jgi:hypothetical protein
MMREPIRATLLPQHSIGSGIAKRLRAGFANTQAVSSRPLRPIQPNAAATGATRALPSRLAALLERYGARRCLIVALLALAAVRALLASRFGLSTDESHYAMFARYPAWGYFDHPPMVGWLGALTSTLGRSPFFYRLGPILCSLATLAVLWRLALRLYDDRRLAPTALFLFLLLPVHQLLALALLPDATLNLFWCAGMLAAWHAFETRRWGWWLATGLCFGGMLLSKYHGVLFPLCLFLYAALSRETRPLLWSPKPYAAGLIGLLVFSPNILWNARNEWISYLYQIRHGGGSGVFEFENLLEAVGGQLAAASPVLFVLLVVAALRRPATRADRFAFCLGVPVFLFFGTVGLFGKILPHWPATGWFGGALLLASALVRAETQSAELAQRWRQWTRIAAQVAGISLALMFSVIIWPLIPAVYRPAQAASERLHRAFPSVPPLREYRPRMDISNDLYGWSRAAREIEALRAAMPRPERTFVFCHRFYLTSLLAVHLDPVTAATALHRPGQYQLWFDPQAYAGWDALFVDYRNRWHQGPQRYRGHFDRMDDTPRSFTVERGGETVHAFDVYRYYGYRGTIEE